MGLFGGKTTIQVASTVYNMAGDTVPRPDFLKSVVFSAVMSPNQPDLSDTIVQNYINGPGNTQRRFFRWSDVNDYAGMPSLQIDKQYPVDTSAVTPEIPLPGTPVGVQAQTSNAFITSGDFTPFVDQYVFDTYPELAATDYISEYYEATHEFLISYADASTEIISAGDYDVNKQFLVAYYHLYLDSDVLSPVLGTKVEDVTDSGLLPDLTGYTLDSMTNTGVVTYTFADTTTEDFDTILSVYTKSDYLGGGGVETVTTRVTTISIWERRYVVTGDHLEAMYDHQTDYQDTVSSGAVGNDAVYIYEIGTTNPTLDALASAEAAAGDKEFFPLIPIRLNNMSILDPTYDSVTGNGLYDEAKTAYKKMTNNSKKFVDLVTEIEDNPDLGDIDYAYIQFGVALNAYDKVAKEYMYRFFTNLMGYQTTDSAYMADFVDHVTNYAADQATLQDWVTAQTDPGDPLYGTTKPSFPSIQSPEVTTIRLQCTDARLSSSDMRMSWISILESTHSGLGKVGAKVGELWFVKETPLSYTIRTGMYYVPGEDPVYNNVSNTIEVTSLYWQTSSGAYKKLTIYGLVHQNFIYKGKYVQITAHQALDDADASGFLVPLHRPTMKEMGMKDATQLAMSNTYLVFNSYLVHKQKWYETFLGQLLIIIAIVVVSVLLSPAAFAGAGGVLGTNVAIGASLGLVGISAILAGAIANALAAILVSSILTGVSKELFGAKWGALIGAILGFAFTFGLSGGFSGNFLQNLFTPGNLLKLGNVIADGLQGYAQGEIEELNQKSIEAEADYQAKMKELNDRLNEFGGNDLIFDPMQLTGISTGNGLGIGLYLPETADEFIQRTLMVGSDMYDLTLGFIENFTKISLTLPDTD
jgi:hypothetical protein